MSVAFRRNAYDPEQWRYRVDLAALYFQRMTERHVDTRLFSTCFEMHDGDLIMFKITKRAKKNARLAAGLLKSGTLSGWAARYHLPEPARTQTNLGPFIDAILAAMKRDKDVLAAFALRNLPVPR